MFQRLRTISYAAPDLNAAKEWYTQLLGFGPYFDEPFYVGFDVNGCELGLVPDQALGTPDGPVTYWKVDDANAALARLHEMGARLHHPIQDVGEGILVAAVLDPFGNVVGVISEPAAH